jgi:hypothetical protein
VYLITQTCSLNRCQFCVQEEDDVEKSHSAICCPSTSCTAAIPVRGCSIFEARSGSQPPEVTTGLKCQLCGIILPPAVHRRALEAVHDGTLMLKEVSRLAVVGQCAEALAELLKWEGFRILHPFHPLFGQACHTRSRLHFEQRAYAAAFDASRRALESVRARFSEHSVPRANAAAWAAALAATAKVETPAMVFDRCTTQTCSSYLHSCKSQHWASLLGRISCSFSCYGGC